MLSSERREDMPRRSPYVIELSPEERGALERMAAKYSSPYREVMRAKIVLYAAEGLSNEDIASRLDLPRQVVSKWRKRFFEEGMPGLAERPRRGRPAVFSPTGRG
ncbi:MAG: helix-turn-helix domain-containing protein [Acidimicrobiia bacterium]